IEPMVALSLQGGNTYPRADSTVRPRTRHPTSRNGRFPPCIDCAPWFPAPEHSKSSTGLGMFGVVGAWRGSLYDCSPKNRAGAAPVATATNNQRERIRTAHRAVALDSPRQKRRRRLTLQQRAAQLYAQSVFLIHEYTMIVYYRGLTAAAYLSAWRLAAARS